MELESASQPEDESKRIEIRKELSHMSFEELLQLKEELGSKVYNEAMFGTATRKNVDYKRENKNRPREVSSKLPVPPLKEVFSIKKIQARDPRFDSLCGTFNEKSFKSSYSFLNEVKQKELKDLREELKTTKDQNRIETIKYLIQRLENQEREEKRNKMKEQKVVEERKTQITMLKQGKKPNFVKPSEKRVLQLVERFKELKEQGKLKKHIQKQRKKATVKDRKKFKEQSNVFG
ncbi:ribosomal RNA processing protein 36 homolog [Bacillus rossius redtenbacheri]|uniref:ribosomal RNA processing protein 36 homolog n=1 Tax=Bacillus rossius redtenbacheri TaxID=93214 RepID=UPI002FDCAE1A